MAKRVVQRYNVSVPKQYTTAQGETKTQWLNIGSAVQFDDGSIMQTLNTLPTGSWWDGTCQLFVRKDQQGGAQQGGGYPQSNGLYQQEVYPTQSPTPQNDGPF